MFASIHVPQGSPLKFFLEPIAVGLNYVQTRAAADGFARGEGCGVLVLGLFGVKPGAIPVDVILIIMGVIAAIAAMQVAGGLDYLVHIATRILKKNPKYITFLAPVVTYTMTLFAGTGHTAFSTLPVIAEVAKLNGIRPSRPLSIATVASQIAVTASPISAAVVFFSKELEKYGVDYVKLLMVAIPSSFLACLLGAVVANFLGKDLKDDPVFQDRRGGSIPVHLRAKHNRHTPWRRAFDRVHSRRGVQSRDQPGDQDDQAGQGRQEKEQAKKFVHVFSPEEEAPWETKRLSKPVTIVQFVNLMSKFIGEPQAHAAISEYIGEREIDEKGGLSEFELPAMRNFTEKTLAGALGAAAAGAVVDSFLSGMGSRLEPVYDIYSKVRSDLKESRENLYVRLRASEIMNRTLDLRIIMDELLELVCREFRFDLAIIRLINEKGVLTTCSFSGKDIPGITEREIMPDTATYIGDAFLANESRFVNDTSYVTKPESIKLLDRQGIRSFAHVPIAREGEPPLGILSAFSTSITGLFTEPFLDLLASLAGQLAQAVKIDSEMKAREQERREKEKVLNEMEIAKQIQLSLLPETPPRLKGVQIACRCVPATHVGGDYYDFFPYGERAVDIVIADVSGHSVGAALIMAETRSALRTQIHSSGRAGEILAVLNDLLHEDLSRAELFITMFYAKYDGIRGILTYTNAGHNPPLLFRPGERSFTELDADGLILGIMKNETYEERSITLQKGDVLFLYTDGIIEAQNSAGDLFGVARLCDLIAAACEENPETIVDTVLKKVADFTGSPVFNDDVSMVLLKFQDA